jgi:uncharacterized protein YbbC (DUF1343 family)
MRRFFIKNANKLTMFYLTLFLVLFTYTATAHNNNGRIKLKSQGIILGAEQVTYYLPMLMGKRVGLVVNQTSKIANKHLVDMLIAKHINVQAIFAPEHGFRGDHDAGEKFSSSRDEKTGIPLISIYGKNRKPSAEILANIDVIIFDIQDVGVRFYTYISSMHYMMEAAADAGVSFIVFDRPNPNGAFVDGPMLEAEFTSFVGMHKIPLLHGMTIGELALMFKGEAWLNTTKELNLTVVGMKNYQRTMAYSLPIKPSPNLPNDVAINLYPSLGFFEATPVSIGRGTDFPFQVIGHNKITVGDFDFMPISTPGASSSPKLMNQNLVGQDLRQSHVKGIDLSFIIKWHQAFKVKNTTFFTRASFMDKLSGSDKLRKAIVAGKTEQEIKQSWQQGLLKFKRLRKPYLLYTEPNVLR